MAIAFELTWSRRKMCSTCKKTFYLEVADSTPTLGAVPFLKFLQLIKIKGYTFKQTRVVLPFHQSCLVKCLSLYRCCPIDILQ